MLILPDILALLVAAAGWYYMFYSRAAHKLGSIENAKLNLERIRLRRINGFIMMLFAIFFFAGLNTVDPKRHPAVFLLVWGCAFALLGTMVVLALVDVRLTARLRRRRD